MHYSHFHRLLAVAALLPLLSFGGSGGGSCNLDVPLVWTIQSTYVDGMAATLITSDGSPYVNGQSGVIATIKICEGTNDAVLQLGSRQRQFTVNFSQPLATNRSTPAWANGPVGGQGVLNVRNITFVPFGYTRADEYVFTTRAGSQLPVKGLWNFRTWNPVTDAISTADSAVAAANSPYSDSLVYAHHCPANSTATTGPCTGVVHETWFVYVDTASSGFSSQTGLPLAQVGGLEDTQTLTPVNAGQFSIRFYYAISLVQ
jgi:hypothetical protein